MSKSNHGDEDYDVEGEFYNINIRPPTTYRQQKQNTLKISALQVSEYQQDQFPQSAQFLDFGWTKTGLSGQHRGVLSGLKPVEWKHWIHIDKR